jgi:hypothetical protein
MARANGKKGQGKVTAKMGVQDAIEMGVTAVEKGDRTGAYDIFKQTSALHPNSSEVWVWLGGTSPDLQAAESAFERAYTLNPDNEEASLGLRWVRLQRKVSLADIVGATVPAIAATPEHATYTPQHVGANVPSTVQCPNCGTSNNSAENFCVQCGQDLSKAPGGDGASEQSKRGLDKRTIIIAAIMVVVALVVVAAVLFLLPH